MVTASLFPLLPLLILHRSCTCLLKMFSFFPLVIGDREEIEATGRGAAASSSHGSIAA